MRSGGWGKLAPQHGCVQVGCAIRATQRSPGLPPCLMQQHKGAASGARGWHSPVQLRHTVSTGHVHAAGEAAV